MAEACMMYEDNLEAVIMFLNGGSNQHGMVLQPEDRQPTCNQSAHTVVGCEVCTQSRVI